MKKFSFDHVIISPAGQIGLHKQGSWELTYIMRGSGVRTIGASTGAFHPGEIVLVVPGMQHRWKFDAPAATGDGMVENITITFLPALIADLSVAFEEMHDMALWYGGLECSIQLPGEESKIVGRIMENMVEEDDSERLISLLRLLVLIWRCDAKRRFGPLKVDTRKEVVDRVIAYLHCNFKRQVTVKQLAAYSGMNGSSLCSLFKHMTHKTIMQYLLEYRLGMVKECLVRDGASVSQVAYECGFRDIPYFNRTFKKHVGMTPVEYRDSHASSAGE